jgi:hypothetical protein
MATEIEVSAACRSPGIHAEGLDHGRPGHRRAAGRPKAKETRQRLPAGALRRLVRLRKSTRERALPLAPTSVRHELRKGLDWDVMDRLHARGWIDDPRGAAKSIVLTEEGIRKARELFDRHFKR